MQTPRKKVLFVITKSNWGGAQRYVYDLATGFADRYEVVVALGGEGVLARKLRDAGVRTITITDLARDINIVKEVRSFVALWKIIRSERPDVIHLNSSKAGGLGGFLSRVLGVPRIIFTAHGWAFNEERPAVLRVVIAFLHWLTVLLSHRTIAVSASVKDQIVRFPLVAQKVCVIHPAIHQTPRRSRDDARTFFEEEIGRSLKDTFLVGTVAELHPVKDYPTALSGFAAFHKNHPQSAYLIMGDGAERERLEALARELEVDDAVHFLGFVEEAASYLPALDAFLLTSRSEAFGYALLEAGLAGVPVIATDVGGIPEIITDETLGTLVPHGDPSAVAAALAHPREGDALHARIIARFSPERMEFETEALYVS